MTFLLLLFSPFVGSFLGVVILRMSEGRSIAFARSECESCRQTLMPFDMVPVASWLVFRRRCRYCDVALPVFYPLVELGALVPVVWAMLYVTQGQLLATASFGWILIALAAIDWRVQRLPNELTVSLLVGGLFVAFLFDRNAWIDHVIGAVGGFVGFATIAYLYRLVRKRDGLGGGDAKLLAGIGAWVAWQGIPTVILLGSLFALLGAIVHSIIAGRMEFDRRIPFGPFLAFAGWIVWLYGPLVPK